MSKATNSKSTQKPSREAFRPFCSEAKAPDVVICPSMLSSDFADARGELTRCRRAGTPWIHVDVMDGHFVPNITLGPPILAKWTKAMPGLFYDAHLMIEKPMDYVEAFAKAGANLLTLHVETLTRPARDLRLARRLAGRVGVTIKPKTPVREIVPLLKEVDLVLVMTVEPGFGGQALIAKTLNKVRELDLLRRSEKWSFRLQVDGGIDPLTAPLAVAAGADSLVAGSAVFKDGKILENVKLLRAAIAGAPKGE